MQSVLKTFRIPAEIARFLEDRSIAEARSQTDVLIEALESAMGSKDQWNDDLARLSMDTDYLEEQIAMAEEHYETFEAK
jgi:hypothetical protein